MQHADGSGSDGTATLDPAAAPRQQQHLPLQSVGTLLRTWRNTRRRSQLDLALDAQVSTRHLSFVENGRARPSAELLLALAERLAVPLRERNQLLLAAGYAPRFTETPIDSPDLHEVRASLLRLLDAHDPYPGLALDRCWNVVLANGAAQRLLAALPPALARPAPNLFRAALHPQGFAAITENFDAWGSHMLDQLERIAAATLDPAAAALLAEVREYPGVRELDRRRRLGPPAGPAASGPPRILVPCIFRLPQGRLSLFTALATLGSPLDVTLAELTLELYYPADAASAALLRHDPSAPVHEHG